MSVGNDYEDESMDSDPISSNTKGTWNPFPSYVRSLVAARSTEPASEPPRATSDQKTSIPIDFANIDAIEAHLDLICNSNKVNGEECSETYPKPLTPPHRSAARAATFASVHILLSAVLTWYGLKCWQKYGKKRSASKKEKRRLLKGKVEVEDVGPVKQVEDMPKQQAETADAAILQELEDMTKQRNQALARNRELLQENVDQEKRFMDVDDTRLRLGKDIARLTKARDELQGIVHALEAENKKLQRDIEDRATSRGVES
jgi:hypothetical protein